MNLYGKTLESSFGQVTFGKKENTPTLIKAETPEALAYGLGWMDSQMHSRKVLMWRALAQGRLAEYFPKVEQALDADQWMRFWNLPGLLDKARATLDMGIKGLLQAFCQGFNNSESERTWGLFVDKVPKMTVDDLFLMAFSLSLVDWKERHGSAQAFLLHLLSEGMPTEKILEIFPDADDLCPDWRQWGRYKVSPPGQAGLGAVLTTIPQWRSSAGFADKNFAGGFLTMVMDSGKSPLHFVSLESPRLSLTGAHLPGLPFFSLASGPQQSWIAFPDTKKLIHWERIQTDAQEIERRNENFFLGKKMAGGQTYFSLGPRLLPEITDGSSLALCWNEETLEHLFTGMMLPWAGVKSTGSQLWPCGPLHPWVWVIQSGEASSLFEPGRGLQTPQDSPLVVTQECPGPQYVKQQWSAAFQSQSHWTGPQLKALLLENSSLQAQKILSLLRHLLPAENPRAQVLRKWDYKVTPEVSFVFETLYLSLIHRFFGAPLSRPELWKDWNGLSAFFNENFGRFDRILFSPSQVWVSDQQKSQFLSEAVQDFLQAPIGEEKRAMNRSLAFRGWVEQMGESLLPVAGCHYLLRAKGEPVLMGP